MILDEIAKNTYQDNIYGIPQEKKYPMPDKKHVLSAIKLFGHVEPKYEKQLAEKIIENMKKYNIDPSIIGEKNKLKKYIQSIDDTMKEDATGNAIVGSNMPESIYLIDYLQNNTFSGYKERKLAICRDNMSDIHTIEDGIIDHLSLEEFTETAEQVKVYKYKNNPVEDFHSIIQYAQLDTDFYFMLTGRILSDKDFIQYDNEFEPTICILDILNDIKDTVKEAVFFENGSSVEYKRYELPILSEYVEGRHWNYYTDINGVFIKNEVTGLRSSSYENKDMINELVIDRIKKGTPL